MNTPHPHAEFIAEALKDTSRKIEGMHPSATDGKWLKYFLSEVITAHSDFKFRFADAVQPECVSPLTDAEIDAVWWSLKPVGNEMTSHHEIVRALAIAAKIATLREVAAMAFDTSLLECNGGGFSAAAMSQFSGECVAEFQRTLLAGTGIKKNWILENDPTTERPDTESAGHGKFSCGVSAS